MKIKEINLNDLIAIIMAGLIVITLLIVSVLTSIPQTTISVLTAYLGLTGGYIGARALNKNDKDTELVQNTLKTLQEIVEKQSEPVQEDELENEVIPEKGFVME